MLAGDIDSLLQFACSYYGPRSHQAKRSRVEWLLQHNPLSKGLNDVIVAATEEGRIIGCHWKTRLGWNWEGSDASIPSLHDLAILPEFQNGQGLQLVFAALAGEQKAGLLGLSSISDGIYNKMRCPLVPMVRFQKILSYTRVAFGMAGFRPSMPKVSGLHKRSSDGTVRLYLQPQMETIQSALALPYGGSAHQQWTAETFRWRFFHPLGPKNFLVLLGKEGRAVCSFGVRKGALLSRVVDAAVAHPTLYPALFEAVEWSMRQLGIAVATTATTCAPAIEHLATRGWSRQEGVSSRFFLRGTSRVEMTDVWGGSYDYGFDAD